MAPATCEERKGIPAGSGLFATKDLKSGSPILQDREPFVAVLDSPSLTKTCAWCFVYAEETSPDEIIKISACTGCQILRYCGKACQTASWKHSHKWECKVYKRLYPQVLPNTARMILQILLRRKHSAIAEADWNAFLRLQHHMAETEAGAAKGSEYLKNMIENLQLMARAGKEYSESQENLGLIETLVGRLITNTMTLTTPIFTPLGLALSLPTSLINHSCAPNVGVTFSHRTLSLRALHSIPAGTELTVAYINTTLPTPTRQSELQNRYHFSCTCSQCSQNLTLNRPDTHPGLGPLTNPSERIAFETRIAELVAEAKALPSASTLTPLAKAFTLFKPYPAFPPFFSPLQQLRQDLLIALQANGFWTAALIQSLTLHVLVDPTVYPAIADPARIGRVWVRAKLAAHVAALANEPVSTSESNIEEREREHVTARALAAKFELDWGLVIWTLITEVSGNVLKSHGPESVLSLEVGREMARLREEAKTAGGEPSRELVDMTRHGLEKVAKEGWDWWKGWEGERRQRTMQKALVASGQEGEEDGVGILLS